MPWDDDDSRCAEIACRYVFENAAPVWEGAEAFSIVVVPPDGRMRGL